MRIDPLRRVTRSPLPAPGSRLAGLLLLALLLAACRFDEQAVAPGRATVAVHGVLNPQRASQVILVEQTLTGRVEVDETPASPTDPIVSQQGVPISGARVVVYGPSGDSAVAREDRLTRSDDAGAGVYRFANASQPAPGSPVGTFLPVVPGGQYALRVTTPDGAVVTGETVVPVHPGVIAAGEFRQFNRDRDSIFLFWPAVDAAYRYELRFDTPRGPLQLFVDSLEYLVSGELRNVYDQSLPATFVPGFTQTVAVAAVDRNYYDYFRTRSDPITGTGAVTHLRGGLGLFGAYTMIRFQTLGVVGDLDDPREGAYKRVGSASPEVPSVIEIWIESSAGGRLQLSGRHSGTGGVGSVPPGVVGIVDDQHITLALLRGQFVTDTALVLEGTFEGGRLAAAVRGTGERVEFRR